MSCLDSANLALLAKWWSRLTVGYDDLRCSCVKAIHNIMLIDGKPLAKKSLKGVCLDIANLDKDFRDKGIELNTLFRRVIGKGDKTHFWKDVWCVA